MESMDRYARALGASLMLVLGATGETAERQVDVRASGQSLFLQPAAAAGELHVRVTGPQGYVLERLVPRGEGASLRLAEHSLADGAYRYEIGGAPLEKRVRGVDSSEHLPQGFVESGAFQVVGGVIVPAGGVEPPTATKMPAEALQSFADGVCVGFDCPPAPSYGDTTVLMMENNTRIKYDDTSVVAGYPNRDWALNANDSGSGGLNRFWIQDCGTSSGGGCTGNPVFSIEANAPTNSLYVDEVGRVGLGTGAPVLDIHNRRGNTPAMRLEQDNSSGFTPQTWDVGGNDGNFFVRDVTGGSRLPFRIRPGAPTSSIDIASSGDVGIGAPTPAAALNVKRTNGTARVLVEDTANSGDKVLLHLKSGASVNKVRFLYEAGSKVWSLDNNGGSDSFSIQKVGGGGLTIDSAGNVTALSFSPTSDRNAKDDIVEADAHAILDKLTEMPISTWRYKDADDRHVGPMAQDFYSAFGFGKDDTHIGYGDMSGVALAALKALNEIVEQKQQQLESLARQNGELSERVAALEAAAAGGR